MELLKLNFRKIFIFLVLGNIVNPIDAQTKVVIIDSETMLPIPYVSIYTKGENIRGSMGNEFGKYSVDFECDTLYFSHINYELVKLATRIKSDTIFMNPIVNTISEIVVTAENPQWIDVLLKDVVKNKAKNYQLKQAVLEYEFNIKSLSDSSAYAFFSSGNIISPGYSEKEAYKICPISNIIKYKDKTAGKDFMQLRRSVYNNFIYNFDNSFIKKHQFARTSFEDQENENLLQFAFKSKKDEEDNIGYVVIDTLTKAIIEFEQISNTDYNIKSNTSSFARTIASQRNFKYTIWSTMVRGYFSFIDGSYHLTDCRYQLYRQNEYKEGKGVGVFFTNIESILTMKQSNEEQSKECDWIRLPNPRSITIIVSKSTRLAEEALDRLPAEYELF